MRKCEIRYVRRTAPELSIRVHRAAGVVGVGMAARGWLAVSIAGLIVVLLLARAA